MQSTTDVDEVILRIGVLQDLTANLRLGGRRVWMRLESNKRHDQRHEGYPTFEEVIGVEAGDMATAFGENGNAWRTLFKETKPRAGGFVHGVDKDTVFISVASTENGAKEKSEDLSPTTGRKMNKKMMKQVQSKFKTAWDLSDHRHRSRPTKRQKVNEGSNDRSTGTSAEPKTTSTSASEPPSSNDGAPLPETSRKRKATGDAAQVSPPTARKDDSSVDKMPVDKMAAALNIELDMEQVRRDVMDAFQRHLDSANVTIPPDFDKKGLAMEVLTELVSKSKTGTAELTSKTIDGRQKTRTFTIHPERRRPPKPESTNKSQADYVRKHAAKLGQFADSILYADTSHERALARRVIGKVAEKYDGRVLKVDDKFETLSMLENNYIRDKIRVSSSAMVELSAMINAIRPDLLSVSVFGCSHPVLRANGLPTRDRPISK